MKFGPLSLTFGRADRSPLARWFWTIDRPLLAMLLVLIGCGAWLGNAAAFVGPPLAVWALNALQIRPEERVMRARFGDDYARYAARVRRWL